MFLTNITRDHTYMQIRKCVTFLNLFPCLSLFYQIDRIYHAVSEHCLHIEVDGHVMLKECAPSTAQSWKLASRT